MKAANGLIEGLVQITKACDGEVAADGLQREPGHGIDIDGLGDGIAVDPGWVDVDGLEQRPTGTA